MWNHNLQIDIDSEMMQDACCVGVSGTKMDELRNAHRDNIVIRVASFYCLCYNSDCWSASHWKLLHTIDDEHTDSKTLVSSRISRLITPSVEGGVCDIL